VNVSLFHYLPNLSILLCNLIFISHFNQTVNAVCFSMYKQKRINSCLNAVFLFWILCCLFFNMNCLLGFLKILFDDFRLQG
jgi:hypothetical protein